MRGTTDHIVAEDGALLHDEEMHPKSTVDHCTPSPLPDYNPCASYQGKTEAQVDVGLLSPLGVALITPQSGDFNVVDERLRGFRVSFSMSTFIFEFLTHLFYPLSVLVVLYRQGVVAAINKGLIPGKTIFFIQSLLTILMFAPPALTYALDERCWWGRSPSLLVSSFAIFRIFVVAGKYACLPKEQYRAMNNREWDVRRTLLLNTWSTGVEEALIDDLLHAAMGRTDIQLHEIDFLLVGGAVLNAYAFVRQLLQKVFRGTEGKNVIFFVRVVCTMPVILFCLYKFAASEAYNNGSMSFVILAIIIPGGFFFTYTIYGFMCVGVLHYFRLKKCQMAIVKMLAFSKMRNRNVDPMMIDASRAENLFSWVSVYDVVSHFAEPFTNRVSFNTLSMLVTLGILVAILIVQSLLKVNDLAFTGMVSVIFVCFSLGLLLTALMAYQANRYAYCVLKYIEEENFVKHWRVAVLRRGVKREAVPSYLDPQSRCGIPQPGAHVCGGEPEQYFHAVEVVREYLARKLEVSPLKLMFVAATIEIVGFFASILISGALLIISLVSAGSVAH